MMFEWYSMFAYTRRPAREQALANTSADALIPLPWGPPIIQVSRFFCTGNTPILPNDRGTRSAYGHHSGHAERHDAPREGHPRRDRSAGGCALGSANAAGHPELS